MASTGTQTRIFDWADDDLTARLVRRFLQMIPPGRYAGFDIDAVTTTGTTLGITHVQSGVKEPYPYGTEPTAWSNPYGVWIAQSGQVVHEYASQTLSGWIPNTTASARIDIVYGRLYYQANVRGGVPANYFFAIGTAGSGQPPALDEYLDVPLIRIDVPANVSDLADPAVVFTSFTPPEFARQNLRALVSDLETLITNHVSNITAQFTALQNSFTALQNRSKPIFRDKSIRLSQTLIIRSPILHRCLPVMTTPHRPHTDTCSGNTPTRLTRQPTGGI